MKWPRTLASRLALIFFTGLVLAYGLSFGLQATSAISAAAR